MFKANIFIQFKYLESEFRVAFTDKYIYMNGKQRSRRLYSHQIREYLHSQLDRRIQLQNLIAGSIPRNSKLCVNVQKW